MPPNETNEKRSNSSSSGRGGGRRGGGGGRGRGRGRGGRSGGGRGRGKGGRYNNRDRGGERDGGGGGGAVSCMGDEEVLIAFTPHLRSGDAEAVRVHEEYGGKGQRAFIAAAREYLAVKNDASSGSGVGGGGGGGGRGGRGKGKEKPTSPHSKRGASPKASRNQKVERKNVTKEERIVEVKKKEEEEEVPKESNAETSVANQIPVEPPIPTTVSIVAPPPATLSPAPPPPNPTTPVGPPPGLTSPPPPPSSTTNTHSLDLEMNDMVHNLTMEDIHTTQPNTPQQQPMLQQTVAPMPPPPPPPPGMMMPPRQNNQSLAGTGTTPPSTVSVPTNVVVNSIKSVGGGGVVEPVFQQSCVIPSTNVGTTGVVVGNVGKPVVVATESNPPPVTTINEAAVTEVKTTNETTTQNSETPKTTTTTDPTASPKPKIPLTILPPPPKKEWQPRRTQTRLSEQPGRILANNTSASPTHSPTVKLRPRQELTAKWMLPLAYLRERVTRKYKQSQEEKGSSSSTTTSSSPNPQNLTIRDALQSLTVGLFRLGCPENGVNSSIIAKEILYNPKNSNEQQRRADYPFEIDPRSDSIWGTVPFYAPRTPGNVVLRLYFENGVLETLATGPTVEVCVSEGDVEPTLRFILSNFKSKKGTVSISSLHSLSAVLDQFRPSGINGGGSGSHHHHHHHHGGHGHRHGQQQHVVGMGHRTANSAVQHTQQNQRSWYDGAGRAAWGCICEARKVLELAGTEYVKKRDKFLKQEEEYLRFLEEEEQKEKEREEEEEGKEEGEAAEHDQENEKEEESSVKMDSNEDAKDLDNDANGEKEEAVAAAAEKVESKKPNYGEKAANERKWKDIQSAFASILKSVLGNNASNLLLKRDLITKLRLEYELWCPLCESFAPNPFPSKENGGASSSSSMLPGDISNFPHPVTAEHWKMVTASRADMQSKELGFVPVTGTILQSLAPSGGKHRGGGNQNQMKLQGNALDFFNRFSVSMEELYNREYATAERIHERREQVRARTEQLVQQCESFPNGTRVIIFGSSANGFGSPQSDLDMCLQLPPSASLPDEEDKNGSKAMAGLAEQLDLAGMSNVDTSRLTARIPIVKFDFPLGINDNDQENGEELLLDCDLSMQNPLACLNTNLLHAYSKIIPEIRILASIIKRWAKNRDINNPSRHTLSSYGYIIMLLHFLTFSQPTSNGQVETSQSEQDKTPQQQQQKQKYPSSPFMPIIPNLQWVDPGWLKSPPHTPYQEIQAKPHNQYCMMLHPTETNFWVNTHFNRLNDHQTIKDLQDRLSAREIPMPTLGVLLTSFFRYYAYEFDFKKHVVSLNSTLSQGIMEREAKAESDGWKLYGQTLSIEDPFETFYDVAHVLKQATFQRTKKEFAMAYSKILDSATGNNSAVWNKDNISKLSGDELIDWICEPVPHDE